MADASYRQSIFEIERYQNKVAAKAHQMIHTYNGLLEHETDEGKKLQLRHQANEDMAQWLQDQTTEVLNQVLYILSNQMKNAFSRSDA